MRLTTTMQTLITVVAFWASFRLLWSPLSLSYVMAPPLIISSILCLTLSPPLVYTVFAMFIETEFTLCFTSLLSPFQIMKIHLGHLLSRESEPSSLPRWPRHCRWWSPSMRWWMSSGRVSSSVSRLQCQSATESRIFFLVYFYFYFSLSKTRGKLCGSSRLLHLRSIALAVLWCGDAPKKMHSLPLFAGGGNGGARSN